MKKISPETWRNYKFAGEEDGKNCTIIIFLIQMEAEKESCMFMKSCPGYLCPMMFLI